MHRKCFNNKMTELMFEVNENKMAYTAKDPCPPWRFLYLTETKSWKWEGGEEEEGEGEKVSLLTQATARGVGKNVMKGKK